MDYENYSAIEFRRIFFKLFGASITMTNPADESVIGLITMKAWKLREDIKLYSDKSQTTQLLGIKARSIIDFGATYDITDSTSGALVVSLRRKGLHSMFVRDHWTMYDAGGNKAGYVRETSGGLAIARRYIGLIPFVGVFIDLAFAFVPATYTVVSGSGEQECIVGSITHRKNPVIVKFGLVFNEQNTASDRQIAVAATALLSVIDASKN